MLMKFKKFQNKFFVHMKTFDVTIDHILVHFIGSKVGLYVSFIICLYIVYILDTYLLLKEFMTQVKGELFIHANLGYCLLLLLATISIYGRENIKN